MPVDAEQLCLLLDPLLDPFDPPHNQSAARDYACWCPPGRACHGDDLAAAIRGALTARYIPGMPNITIPDIPVRTTSDGGGHAHGLALGASVSLDDALQALAAEVRRQAEEIAAAYRGDDHAGQTDAD